MRIAQIAPPWLPIPPKGYGGIENVVYNLVEGLVAAGHDVTLFASGDSKTSARLSAVFSAALGNDGELKKNPYTVLFHIYPAFKDAASFDIIHCHEVNQAMFFAEFIKTPVVHTLHGTFELSDQHPDKRLVYEQFKSQHLVSISESQRLGLPGLNYIKTIYNGIDMNQFAKGSGDGEYVAWIGRITPKKGVVEAIEAAKKINMPLKIAAFVDPIDQKFFETAVKPRIDGFHIQFMGQLDVSARASFLGGAKALLFPIKWQEPFGLVMVEAMATGTPVVAFGMGSVPEIIRQGVTGFVLEHHDHVNPNSWDPDAICIDRVVEGMQKILALSESNYTTMRSMSRRHVEEHFSVKTMVSEYEQVYDMIRNVNT